MRLTPSAPVLAFAALLLHCSALSGCGGSEALGPTSPGGARSNPDGDGLLTTIVPDEVFVGAGDIAHCTLGDSEATAKLLDRIPGTVFTLGDNVQDQGTAEEYERCFGPTWGRHRSRMLPTVGNHDWYGGQGRPYFAYFGDSAGPPGLGYYSTTLGAWHIIALNSEIAAGPGSTQYEWLRTQLAFSNAACTLVMWHRPFFTSGPGDNAADVRVLWQLLAFYGVDLVLSGHNHQYERFAPQDADGRADPAGPRQFVVGTGGYPLYGRTRAAANSEAFDSDAWGVLKLTLQSASYVWDFVPVAGRSFRDAGSGTCVVRRAN